MPESLSKILQQSPIYSANTDSSTQLVDETPSVRENFIESLATKPTAPVSLLVESLVQQLCSMIQTDSTASHQLYQRICEQLYRMHLIDETYAMGEFDVMRSQYQRALYQLATVASGQAEIPLNLQTVWPLSDTASMSLSRYHRDFEELNFIAGGGFGRVYRARNKLDGIEYAVKKVHIKNQTINRVLPHLGEVKTFASLNHMNIVPYKAAWLEPLFDNGTNRPQSVKDKPKSHCGRKKNHGQKMSSVLPILNGFEKTTTVCDIETKFSETTNEDDEADDDESDTGQFYNM